jgi:hypothetical protein
VARHQVIKDLKWVGPKRGKLTTRGYWSLPPDARYQARRRLFTVRQRPIPPIEGETGWEAMVRLRLNEEWMRYEEEDCRQRGFPILLPQWDGPAGLPQYKESSHKLVPVRHGRI